MIKIREAKIKDINLIMDLWDEFLTEHKAKAIKRDPRFKEFFELEKNAYSITEEYMKSTILNHTGTILLAENNNIPIGYIMVEIKDNIPIYKIKRFGYISDLFIKEDYRGRRISSKLYTEAKIWFKIQKIKYITIKVNPKNQKASSIYKHWNFFEFCIDMRNII